MHLSAEQLEICEQSRAEKSKVQVINLRVTGIHLESIRKQGSSENPRGAYVEMSPEQRTEI